MFDLLVQFLAQIGGGPGPPENNLVRFGLPALFWAVLFLVAWSRQRREQLPRERLLLFGFALAFAREFFMFLHTAERIVVGPEFAAHASFIEPLEHALSVSAVLVISAAFLRYILDDVQQPRRYLVLGFAAMSAGLLFSLVAWPGQHAADPSLRFNDTSGALIMHLVKVVFISLAIYILIKNKGWVRNVVIVALSFLLASVVLGLINSLLGRSYDYLLCPISNNLHIWAVPIFGFVYFREQSIARKRAEDALGVYRDHLEQLVEQRTTELSLANEQLQQEVAERARADIAVTRRNAELSAQNLIAATISRSLDLDEVLRAALDQVVQLLGMDSGCILLLGPNGRLQPHRLCQRDGFCKQKQESAGECAYQESARRALQVLEPVVATSNALGNHGPGDPDVALLLHVPLVAHGKALGVLTMISATKQRISEQQLAILASIGHQIGIAVENAGLYREAEQWARGMSRLHEISLELNAVLEPSEICRLITVQAATLLDCTAAGLFRLDEDGRVAVGVASYHMIAGGVDGMRLTLADTLLLKRLIDHGDPLVVEDVRSDPRVPRLLWQQYPMRALLGVPVRGTGDLQGLLFLVEADRPRAWQPAEIRLLVNFTNRAGVAWENAYLHKQLELAAALEERQRIAAEMHDGLAQTISMLALRNDQAAQMVEDGRLQPALTELTQIQDIISVAGNDLRRSIASLRESPRPPCSLQEALAELTLGDFKGAEPTIQFENEIPFALRLPPDEQDQILCIIKEALLNAVRHAQAAQVTIRLAASDTCFAVTVEDDGIGFDLEDTAVRSGNHFGLSIMRARAQRFGGDLTIVTAPGQGTRVLVQWQGTDTTLPVRGMSSPAEAAAERQPGRGEIREGSLWAS